MKQEEIINDIVNNKELSKSPLLLSWIEASEDNLNAYIAYKNSNALLQNGAEMTNREILKDLKTIKKATQISKTHSFNYTFLKYAAILILGIIGGYIYHLSSFEPTPQIAMNEISVPEGNRSIILLPDGSEIVLVNGSKVTYPSQFNGETREVYLEGEAYLIVSHDEERPFKVNIGDNQIEVLGTEFLVTAYPQDDLVMVDLVSGKVKMNVAQSTDTDHYNSYLMEPSESLILDRTTKNVQQLKMEDDFYKFWKEGQYVFKMETFGSLALKLERIYHHKILFEDETISSSKFTGALHSTSSITETLGVFQKASSILFEYRIEKKEIYIKQIK